MLDDLSLETARDASLWGVVGLIVVALLAVWFVKAVLSKVLSVALLLVLAFVVWTQRDELNDCAAEVRASAAASFSTDTSCTFFGRSVTIPGVPATLPGAPTTPTTTSPG